MNTTAIRAMPASTKYPLAKMIGFALDALISFSMVPLRIATYVGALLTTVLTFVGIGAVISWILSGTVPGWTSLTLLVVMISSVQLLVLGLIGEYVGRIYIQSKNRPLFVISHIHRRGRLPHSAADGEDDHGNRCRSKPCWPNRDRKRAATPTTRPPDEGDILSHPALYQAYQNAGGFFGARIKAIADYLTLRPGMRVIDIGCGPGHILRHLPEGIEYTGFDIDEAYIAYARRSFGHLGTFHCRHFDAAAAREFAGADVVMMNGVLHHIADDGLQATLADIRDVLKSDGVLFTLDGCYREGQSPHRQMAARQRPRRVRPRPRRLRPGASARLWKSEPRHSRRLFARALYVHHRRLAEIADARLILFRRRMSIPSTERTSE